MSLGLKIRSLLMVLLLVLSVFAIATSSVPVQASHGEGHPTTFVVDDDGEGDYTTISDALSDAENGDLIEVRNGTYTPGNSIILDVEVSIIGSEGAVVSNSDFGQQKPIFRLSVDDATIKGLTLESRKVSGNVPYEVIVDGGTSGTVVEDITVTRLDDSGHPSIHLGPVSTSSGVESATITANDMSNGGNIAGAVAPGGVVNVTTNEVGENSIYFHGTGFGQLSSDVVINSAGNGADGYGGLIVLEADEHENGWFTAGTGLNGAIGAAVPGTTIEVPSGTYNETIRVPTSDLRIVGDDAAISPQKEPQMDPRQRIVDLSDAPNTTFTGFTVIGLGPSTDDAGIYTGNQGSDDMISDNVIMSAKAGITVGTGVSNVEVTGNDVSDTREGVTALSLPSTISGNNISDSDMGLVTYSGKYGVPHFEPTGNTFTNNEIHVRDQSGNFSAQQLVMDNSFDKGTLIDRPGSSLISTVYGNIGNALNDAQPGDEVRVGGPNAPGGSIASGVYDEMVDVTTDNVTVTGVGNPRIELSPQTVTANENGRVFDIRNDVSNVTIQGFVIVGVSDDEVVGVTVSGENATVRLNHISTVLTAIQTSSRYGTVDGEFKIVESTGNNAEIYENEIEDVGVGVSSQSHGVIVANNSISDAHMVGVSVMNNRSGNVVEHNTLTDIDGPVVSISDFFEPPLENNGPVIVRSNNLSDGEFGLNNSNSAMVVDARLNHWGEEPVQGDHYSGPLLFTARPYLTLHPYQLPIANAGSDQSRTGTGSITLDGSGSFVATSNVTYTWRVDGRTVTGERTSVSLGPGSYTAHLTLNDAIAESDTDSANITVDSPPAGGGGGGGAVAPAAQPQVTQDPQTGATSFSKTVSDENPEEPGTQVQFQPVETDGETQSPPVDEVSFDEPIAGGEVTVSETAESPEPEDIDEETDSVVQSFSIEASGGAANRPATIGFSVSQDELMGRSIDDVRLARQLDDGSWETYEAQPVGDVTADPIRFQSNVPGFSDWAVVLRRQAGGTPTPTPEGTTPTPDEDATPTPTEAGTPAAAAPATGTETGAAQESPEGETPVGEPGGFGTNVILIGFVVLVVISVATLAVARRRGLLGEE